MEKLNMIESQNVVNRNSSFCKNSKRRLIAQKEEFAHFVLPQIKTVKVVNRKSNHTPFLNIDNLTHLQRLKAESLKERNHEKHITERKKSTNNSQDVSFLLREFDMKKTNKNVHNSKQKINDFDRKKSLLPAIFQYANTSPVKLGKRSQLFQQPVQMKKKGPRNKIHCKVLLGRHNEFPFMGSHVYEPKKIDRIKTKQTNNPESQLFDLDISRIVQDQQMRELEFISKDSLQQIQIF